MAESSRNAWNGLAAVIAAFVGFLALLVSAYTAYIQRQQTRAQVWPRLLLGVRPDQREFLLYNKGIGPAIVRTVQVYVDGKPQRDWNQVVAAMDLKLSAPPVYSTLGTIVVSPGEELHVLKFANEADFAQAVNAAKRPYMRICYCSALEDCWVMDERRQPLIEDGAGCPADPAADFTE